jgi:hypothetical protein
MYYINPTEANNRSEIIMTNLQKRDLSQSQAFAVYSKIDAAWEAGDFKEVTSLNESYERLTANAIMWEQKQLNS